MINFYKEDNVAKIQFESGEVISFTDNVSVRADNTTNQIIITENNRDMYWINISNTLQVEGETITGTNNEKAALIAPVFQTTGGGASGRFGIEDNTSTGNRIIDMGGHELKIINVSNFDVLTGEGLLFGELNVAPGNAVLRAQDETGDNFSELLASGEDGYNISNQDGEGVSGTFTTTDGKTITVVSGVIKSIV